MGRLAAVLELLTRAQALVADELTERDTPSLRVAEEAIRAACEAVRDAGGRS